MTNQMEWVFSAVGHLSFALSAAGYLTADIVRLRVLAVCSVVLGIVFNATLATGPLWITIFWLSIFLVANVWRLFTGSSVGRKTPVLGQRLAFLGRVFPAMRAQDWQKLIEGVPVEIYRRGDSIPCGGMCVVTEGRVSRTGRSGGAMRVDLWGAADFLGGEAHVDDQGALIAETDQVALLRLPVDRARSLACESDGLNAAILDGFLRATMAAGSAASRTPDGVAAIAGNPPQGWRLHPGAA